MKKLIKDVLQAIPARDREGYERSTHGECAGEKREVTCA